MAYDEKVWAMLGSISGDSTHIGLRVSLKTEVPIVNSAATDPTIPETIIPWYLSRRFRMTGSRATRWPGASTPTSAHPGRAAAGERSLRPVRCHQIPRRRPAGWDIRSSSSRSILPGSDRLPARQLGIIADSGADGIVIWGDAAAAAGILKQMRELGMKQRVFGSFRTIGDELAGGGRERGRRAWRPSFPFDPDARRPGLDRLSRQFRQAFRPPARGVRFTGVRHHEHPAGRRLPRRLEPRTNSRCTGRAGELQGCYGQMTFDPNSKNIVPMYLATVRNGAIQYRRYGMEKQYAKVDEGGVVYSGPPLPDLPAGEFVSAYSARAPSAWWQLSADLTHTTRWCLSPRMCPGGKRRAPWSKLCWTSG